MIVMNKNLKETILFFFDKVAYQLTPTKLVKLIYLVDRKAKLDIGESITGLTYKRYVYGPYNEDIIDTLDSLTEQRIIDKKVFVSKRGNSKIYNYDFNKDVNLSSISEDEEDIIKEIITDYADKRTREIVDIVYKLEEVQKADPLEKIKIGGV